MLVPVPRPLLQAQAYDDALRAACDTLSAQGVRNFIHYREPRRVELFDPPRWLEPIVDHAFRRVLTAAVNEDHGVVGPKPADRDIRRAHLVL